MGSPFAIEGDVDEGMIAIVGLDEPRRIAVGIRSTMRTNVVPVSLAATITPLPGHANTEGMFSGRQYGERSFARVDRCLCPL